MALKKIGVIVDARVQYTVGGFTPTPADRAEAHTLQAQGLDNVRAEVSRALGAKGYTVVMLPNNDDTRAVLKEYYAARGAINSPFPATQGNPSMAAALPAAAALAEKAGIDGIVIVNGQDSKLTAAATLATIAEVVAGLVLVAGMIAVTHMTPPMGTSGESYDADFTLLDGTGKIMFYERDNMAVLDRKSVQRANSHFSDGLTAPRP